MGLVLTVKLDQQDGGNTVLIRNRKGGVSMRLSLAPGTEPNRVLLQLEAPADTEFVRPKAIRRKGISDEDWLAGAPGTERPPTAPRQEPEPQPLEAAS